MVVVFVNSSSNFFLSLIIKLFGILLIFLLEKGNFLASISKILSSFQFVTTKTFAQLHLA
jgi:hypothetical protein